ncbi:MAG: NAD(P)H-dependent oxidoreductase [Deltaproteobacteria bacterium]|nr:NAD(P)H-dependent oxidoreductase [Deltaproteobacteria bacterium]
MKVLAVYAHPNPKSFAHALLTKVVETCEIKKHQTVVRDLYAINFKPILTAEDLTQLSAGKTPQDIKTEQDHIRWADVLVIIYPLWWTGLPAILKGYIDRVFCNGFAFSYGAHGPTPLLKEKKIVLITNQGTPEKIYEASGMTRSMKQTSDTGIFEFCGIEVLEHRFFGGVPLADQKTLSGYLKEAESIIMRI